MGYVEKDFSFLYFYSGSYKGFWLLSRNFCQIRKNMLIIDINIVAGLFGKRKVCNLVICKMLQLN